MSLVFSRSYRFYTNGSYISVIESKGRVCWALNNDIFRLLPTTRWVLPVSPSCSLTVRSSGRGRTHVRCTSTMNTSCRTVHIVTDSPTMCAGTNTEILASPGVSEDLSTLAHLSGWLEHPRLSSRHADGDVSAQDTVHNFNWCPSNSNILMQVSKVSRIIFIIEPAI